MIKTRLVQPISQDVWLLYVMRYELDDGGNFVRSEYLNPDGGWTGYGPYSVIEAAISIPGWVDAQVGLVNPTLIKECVERETHDQAAISTALRCIAEERQAEVE